MSGASNPIAGGDKLKERKFVATVYNPLYMLMGCKILLQSTEADGIFPCVHMVDGSNSINELHSSPSFRSLPRLH